MLFLIQNIDCGYSLEPPQHVPTIYVLSKIYKNIKIFPMKLLILSKNFENIKKNFLFLHVKKISVLHGQVLLMMKVSDFIPVNVMLLFKNVLIIN